MAIIQRIIAFFISVLAFFGVGPKHSDPPAQPVDNIASYTCDEKQITFSLVSNPSTGFGWETMQSGESVLKTDESFKGNDRGNLAGAPGTQYYTFTAIAPGKTTVTFRYARAWENNPPAYTYIAVIRVSADLQITLESFTQA